MWACVRANERGNSERRRWGLLEHLFLPQLLSFQDVDVITRCNSSSSVFFVFALTWLWPQVSAGVFAGAPHAAFAHHPILLPSH